MFYFTNYTLFNTYNIQYAYKIIYITYIQLYLYTVTFLAGNGTTVFKQQVQLLALTRYTFLKIIPNRYLLFRRCIFIVR